MKALVYLSLSSLAMMVVAGCNNKPTDTEKSYPLEGTVVSVDTAKSMVTIDHKDVPGLMKAMKMPFHVEKPELLQGLKEGVAIEGKFKVSTDGYTLTELKMKETVSEADAEVRKALAELTPEDRTLAESQEICPIGKDRLGSMGKPIKLMVKGQPVFVCCAGCKKSVENDPDGTLAKLAQAKKKQK